MKWAAPGALTHDGRNNYYISLKGDAVRRASLQVGQSEKGQPVLLLSLHPGDSPKQATALYTGADENRILGLERSRWKIVPNFHFGFAATGLCWIKKPRLSARQYIRFWKTGRLPIKTVRGDKSDFRSFFQRLLRLKLISATDIRKLEQNFTLTKRKAFQIRPGLTLKFEWPRTGKLPDAKRFARQLRWRINQALAACRQQVL